MSAPDWIADDWGTSHLRVWGLKGERVLHHAASDQGMGSLTRDGFEPALLALVADWLPEAQITPVLICGMAGSRQGWDGVLCLPGTHSKWVHVSAGEVVSFQTFLTGEMFALLSEASVLRHSVKGWANAGFAEGIAQGMERPERLLARLFDVFYASIWKSHFGVSQPVGKALVGAMCGLAIEHHAQPFITIQRLAGILFGEGVPGGRHAMQAKAGVHARSRVSQRRRR